jgi:HlyD family secretion protein
MAKPSSKKMRRSILVAAAVVVVALIGWRFWAAKQAALPKGIISGNGRVEATLVDISSKEPLRVQKVLVQEGDLVKPNQVLAQMDTQTLQASQAEARAQVAAAQESVAEAQAAIVKQNEEIALAEIEVDRATKLVKDRAGTQRELDVRRTRVQTTKAGLAEAQASLAAAQKRVEVAQANVATIQTRIDDATLKSPVLGRVLYRLAEPGEVLAAGGKVLTVVNLADLYMEIFIPSEDAGAVKVGAEGRITFDFDKRAIPGYVSFVSPEAQFTPKQVETQSEREKLMFRVKIQVPKEIADRYVERLKTGIRGEGYVRVSNATDWPERLQNLVASTNNNTNNNAQQTGTGAQP